MSWDAEHGVVCDACSVMDDHATAKVRDLEQQVLALTTALGKSDAKARALQSDQYEKLTASKYYEPAKRVLEAWQRLCQPSARSLGGERLKLVIARFNDNETEERLMKAVLGYSRYPYLVNWRRVRNGSKDNWKAEAEFIFRNAKNVEAGIRLAELDEDYGEVYRAPAAPVNQLSQAGQTAIRCIGLGWKVFPCLEGKKTPATQHGLLDATGDADRVTAYWTKVPLANLAVRTGQESNLIVLDVDTDKGGMESLKALTKKYGDLPETLSVVTPSGGQHFYFRHPGHEIRNTTNIPGIGLDIRGDGGYVVAPPSVVDGRPYEIDDEAPVAEMPDWLVNGLRNYQLKQARKGGGQYAALVQRGVTEGARNTQLLSLAGKLVNDGWSPEDMAVMVHSLNKSHCRPPLQASEVDKNIIQWVLGKDASK